MNLPIKLSGRTLRAGVAVTIGLMVLQTPYAAHAQAPNASRASQVSQTGVQDKPFIVEYYYQTKWGYANEFIACSRRTTILS